MRIAYSALSVLIDSYHILLLLSRFSRALMNSEVTIGISYYVAQIGKNWPAMHETRVRSELGRSLGEGNSNPLQCSCLENPMDRGACQTTVLGFPKSWIQLSNTFGLPRLH